MISQLSQLSTGCGQGTHQHPRQHHLPHTTQRALVHPAAQRGGAGERAVHQHLLAWHLAALQRRPLVGSEQKTMAEHIGGSQTDSRK
jgi:hypothetical protein